MTSSSNTAYKLGVALAVANAIGLGFAGFIDKFGIATTATHPLIFTLQNVWFSLLCVTIYGLVSKRKAFIQDIKKISPKSVKFLIVIGICSSGLFTILRFFGLEQSTGTFATISQIVTTSMTALLAFLFLHERLSKQFWIFFGIIITATYFVSVGTLSFEPIKQGDLLILLGTVFLAASNLFTAKAVKLVSPLIVAWGRFLGGSIFLAVICAVLFPVQEIFIINQWALLGGFIGAFMYIMFTESLHRISVTLSTSLLMTASVITMVLEYVVFGQILTMIQLVAAFVLISSGIIMVVTKNKTTS